VRGISFTRGASKEKGGEGRKGSEETAAGEKVLNDEKSRIERERGRTGEVKRKKTSVEIFS